MKRTLSVALLLSILVSAASIRLYNVDVNPNGLFCDEAAMGYNAYSMLLTGRDEYGSSFPLYFKSFGEYKEPVYIYSTVPFVALFGLNEFSTRLASVFYGVLAVLFTYLMTARLFSRKVGLLSAFLVALSISHFHYSRVAFSATALNFFFVSGFYLLIRGLDDRKYLYLSAVPLALCFYSYGVSKVFLPLFLVGFVIIYRKRFLSIKKEGLMALVVLIFLALPVVHFSIFGSGQLRFSENSIFNESNEFRLQVIEGYKQSDLMPDKLRSFEPLISAHVFIKNYLYHFSPDFLFLKGDPQPRHSPEGYGMFHRFYIPLLLLGLAAFIIRRGESEKVILWWVLISPVPDSLLGPDTITRTFVLIPAFEIIAAVGFMKLLDGLNLREEFDSRSTVKAAAAVLITLYGTWNTANFYKDYFTRYPVNSAPFWDYAVKGAIEDIETEFSDYEYVFFPDTFCEPYIQALFHLEYDPSLYQKDKVVGRYVFDRERLHDFKGTKGLVVTNYFQPDLPRPRKVLYYPGGKPAIFFFDSNK